MLNIRQFEKQLSNQVKDQLENEPWSRLGIQLWNQLGRLSSPNVILQLKDDHAKH